MPRLVQEEPKPKLGNRIKLTLQTKYADIDASLTQASKSEREREAEVEVDAEGDLTLTVNNLSEIAIALACQQPSYKQIMMLDIMQCMRKQESTSYECPDYLKKGSTIKRLPFTGMDTATAYTKPNDKRKAVDESCREKIVEWCFRVVDFFNLDRETVSYAMSYLDRFMAVHFVDRYTYKLASTTALLLAIKLHQPNKVKLNSVVQDLSRGQFNEEDVVRMELIMLRSLAWKLHPPTPANYVLRMIAMNPFSSRRIQEFDVESVQHLAVFFVELSSWDYFFVTQKQSMIALAAIVNAMECLGLFRPLQCQQTGCGVSAKNSSIVNYVEMLFDTMNIDCDGLAISECRDRLWNLYHHSEEYANKMKIEQTRRLDRMQAVATIHRSTHKRGAIFSHKRREKKIGYTYSNDVDMEMNESPKSVV